MTEYNRLSAEGLRELLMRGELSHELMSEEDYTALLDTEAEHDEPSEKIIDFCREGLSLLPRYDDVSKRDFTLNELFGKQPKKRVRIRKAFIIAAVIAALLLIIQMVASALGYNLFKYIFNWGEDNWVTVHAAEPYRLSSEGVMESNRIIYETEEEIPGDMRALAPDYLFDIFPFHSAQYTKDHDKTEYGYFFTLGESEGINLYVIDGYTQMNINRFISYLEHYEIGNNTVIISEHYNYSHVYQAMWIRDGYVYHLSTDYEDVQELEDLLDILYDDIIHINHGDGIISAEYNTLLEMPYNMKNHLPDYVYDNFTYISSSYTHSYEYFICEAEFADENNNPFIIKWDAESMLEPPKLERDADGYYEEYYYINSDNQEKMECEIYTYEGKYRAAYNYSNSYFRFHTSFTDLETLKELIKNIFIELTDTGYIVRYYEEAVEIPEYLRAVAPDYLFDTFNFDSLLYVESELKINHRFRFTDDKDMYIYYSYDEILSESVSSSYPKDEGTYIEEYTFGDTVYSIFTQNSYYRALWVTGDIIQDLYAEYVDLQKFINLLNNVNPSTALLPIGENAPPNNSVEYISVDDMPSEMKELVPFYLYELYDFDYAYYKDKNDEQTHIFFFRDENNERITFTVGVTAAVRFSYQDTSDTKHTANGKTYSLYMQPNGYLVQLIEDEKFYSLHTTLDNMQETKDLIDNF